jgi:hypothetical protein
MAGPRLTRLLERVAIVVVAFAISIGIVALLSGGLLAGRDDPGVSAGGAVGVLYRDLGHVHLPPGSLHPLYDSVPPTSGPHVPRPVRRNYSELSVDQLLQALEVGDVVIVYGTRSPPSGLRALADSVASPFTPSLAAAGQAVVLARQPGTRGLIALAWTRMLHVASAGDPNLRAFVQQWLGHGARGR